jgi:molybdopterin converting factor small subunit
VPTVNIEVLSWLARAFRDDGRDGTVTWQEEVAPGETLGRLLERLVNERPPVGALYDPAARRVADHVELVVNGRIYELVGGLTYTLHDGDTVTLFPGYAGGTELAPRA